MGKRKVMPEFELQMLGPIKAMMMILVVVTHSLAVYTGNWFSSPAEPAPLLGLVSDWLGTFHVPVFVFASGYIYSYLKRETNRYGDKLAVLKKKARRLLVPYMAICVLWAVPIWVYFFGFEEVVGKYLFGRSPSQLWFVLILFWCFVFAELACPLIRYPASWIQLAVLCCVIYAVGGLLGKVSILGLWGFSRSVEYSHSLSLASISDRGATPLFMLCRARSWLHLTSYSLSYPEFFHLPLTESWCPFCGVWGF